MHRTQTKFEDAFTLKVFIFQFVNFYSSPIYIAFFKGRSAPLPPLYPPVPPGGHGTLSRRPGKGAVGTGAEGGTGASPGLGPLSRLGFGPTWCSSCQAGEGAAAPPHSWPPGPNSPPGLWDTRATITPYLGSATRR